MRRKQIQIPGIGDVMLEKSPRARRMNLALRPFRGIRVAVPPGVSFDAAEDFARSKTDWMLARLPRLRAAEKPMSRSRNAALPKDGDAPAARAYLAARLETFSRKLGLPSGRVAVRNQKTRWGSCSSRKNINLNINLVWLPECLMDYAIVHELAHTKIMHHGRAFWDFMETLVPNARDLDRELRRYSPLSFMRESENPAPERSEIHCKGDGDDSTGG
jgi:predicted metal-dependent hydrolase